MPIFDHFNLVAPFYERVIKAREPIELISLLGSPDKGLLLDAGGGTGRISQFLKRFEIEVVITDISFGMLQKAAEKDNLLVLCAPTEKLPFGEGTFSRIIMVDALHHVIDQRQSAIELWRVLKPGGRLVIEEPDIQHFPVRMVALAEKLALMRSHFLLPEQIARFFNHKDATVQIERQHPNAWIVIDKAG
jgi:demethylmenaquinone methyltransferase/2-methoxy-6-polyprenyl-1,4-benzoquinol methylase